MTSKRPSHDPGTVLTVWCPFRTSTNIFRSHAGSPSFPTPLSIVDFLPLSPLLKKEEGEGIDVCTHASFPPCKKAVHSFWLPSFSFFVFLFQTYFLSLVV